MPASNAIPNVQSTKSAPTAFVGWRVVATPAAIDTVAAHSLVESAIVVRVAPDECILAPASGSHFATPISAEAVAAASGDEHVIVEEETGFTSWPMTTEEADRLLRPVLEWELPEAGPFTAQGFLNMVPTKVVATAANDLIVFFPTCYSYEMLDRVR